ncbi:MAG: peptide-methionine (S)-S-oxide reductase MsrA, partial [Thermoplasmataceae archaeon]
MVEMNQTIYLGAGCFWCTEAAYRSIRGVEDITPGYSGGNLENPTYRQVCSGNTGHIEVARVVFNPEITGLEQILEIFFSIHDPTSVDKQGADVGEQYRSVIFYTSEYQKKFAVDFIKRLQDQKQFNRPIVTQVLPFKNFYPAENYHLNYY